MDIEKMQDWARNKNKLLRAIAFVNAGTSETNVSEEKKEQMVYEYYVQIAGSVNTNVTTKEIVGDDVQPVTVNIEESFKCDQCDYVAKKEMGLAIHKGKEHKSDV